MSKLLEIKNLVVEYHTDDAVIHAVNGINFSMEKGQTIGLVGETGAGKTTIAKSILRILPDRQAKIPEGEIIFKDRNILDLSEKEMRKIRGNEIAMIFQDPMTALNPIEKVGDQIAETIRLHTDRKTTSSAEIRERACKMLEMVGIPRDRYEEYPHQFSGGMKQRVVIAMALACSPELLICDEPTTALDVTIQAQVLDIMRELNKNLSTSFILITHDLGVVAEFCDAVAVTYAGEIIESGSLEDIFKHAGHPYTIGLFNSLPSLESKEKRLKPIDGLMADPSNLPSGCHFHDRCPYAKPQCSESAPPDVEVSEGHFIKCHCVEEVKNDVNATRS